MARYHRCTADGADATRNAQVGCLGPIGDVAIYSTIWLARRASIGGTARSVFPGARHPTKDIAVGRHMADRRKRQVSGRQRLAVRRQLPQETDPDAGRLLGVVFEVPKADIAPPHSIAAAVETTSAIPAESLWH